MTRLLRDLLLGLGLLLLLVGLLEAGARIAEPEQPAPRQALLPAAPGHRDTFRLLLLGASSVRGNPVPALGYAAQLAYWLPRSVPGGAEVENSAFAGASSEIILSIAQRALARDPDLAFLHTGMGEFFESESSARSRKWLAALSQYSALIRTSQRLAADARRRDARTRIPDPRDFELVEADSPAQQRGIERYQRNVSAIVELSTAKGVPLLLSTVASNLSDWPPASRAFLGRLYPAGFAATLDEIDALLDTGDLDAARRLIDASLEAHPDDALLFYLLGKVEEASGHYARARELFYAARDHDPLPWRPVSETNDFIRQIARTTEGVYLLDIERVLEANAPNGLVGLTLIGDGAHPTLLGNTIITRAIFEKLAELGYVARDSAYFRSANPTRAYLRTLPPKPPVGELLDEFERKTALFSLKYPHRHVRVARSHLQSRLARHPTSWQVWANLATTSFFERKIDRGMDELNQAVTFKGNADGLTTAERVPYLAEALRHAGVDLEAFIGSRDVR